MTGSSSISTVPPRLELNRRLRYQQNMKEINARATRTPAAAMPPTAPVLNPELEPGSTAAVLCALSDEAVELEAPEELGDEEEVPLPFPTDEEVFVPEADFVDVDEDAEDD